MLTCTFSRMMTRTDIGWFDIVSENDIGVSKINFCSLFQSCNSKSCCYGTLCFILYYVFLH